MSTFTNFWTLELPDRGEFPGTWDTPLNANFVLLDTLLQDLHNNRSSNSAPATNNTAGSTWYDLANSLLNVYSGGTYVPIVAHVHDGTISGVPKVNIATEVFYDVDNVLPWAAIEVVSIDASTLGGLTFTQFAANLAGDGLVANGALLDTVEIGTAGTYIKVTTDAKGRVISGANPITISGFGITDVYTKTEIEQNYATLSGASAQLFRVEAPADGVSNPGSLVLTECAVPRSFVEANFSANDHTHAGVAAEGHLHTGVYLPVAGDPAQAIEVADPTGDTFALNRLYADGRYKNPFDTHNALPHLWADGSVQMTAELLLSSNTTPVSSFAAANKQYVINEAAAAAAAGDATRALTNGSTEATFLVAKAPDSGADPGNYDKYALNIQRADELYSVVSHVHPATNIDAQLEQLQSQLDSLDPTEYVTERQAINQARTDAAGAPDYLTYIGLDVHLEGAEVPFYSNIASGYKEDGSEHNKSIVIPLDTATADPIEPVVTLPSPDGTYKVGISYQDYNLVYDVEAAELINGTDVNVAQGANPFNEDRLPITGYVTFSGDATIYTYDRSADTNNDGLLVITFPLDGLQQPLVGTETATFFIDETATINATSTKIEGTSTLEAVTYSHIEPAAPATNEYWFDMDTSLWYTYNGATWERRDTIFIGEATVSGAAIISILAYSRGSQIPATITTSSIATDSVSSETTDADLTLSGNGLGGVSVTDSLTVAGSPVVGASYAEIYGNPVHPNHAEVEIFSINAVTPVPAADVLPGLTTSDINTCTSTTAGSGATFTLTVGAGAITGLALVAAGTGYQVSSLLTIDDQTANAAGDNNAIIRVETVGGSGEILTWTLIDGGTNYTLASVGAPAVQLFSFEFTQTGAYKFEAAINFSSSKVGSQEVHGAISIVDRGNDTATREDKTVFHRTLSTIGVVGAAPMLSMFEAEVGDVAYFEMYSDDTAIYTIDHFNMMFTRVA